MGPLPNADPMTYSFTVGEPAPSWPGSPPPPGGGLARLGPGGLQILLTSAEPDEAAIHAADRGPVSLGFRDGADESALVVGIGEPGRAGHLVGEAPLTERPSWWSADVELALCDGSGVVRAVRRFQGPFAEAEPEDE